MVTDESRIRRCAAARHSRRRNRRDLAARVGLLGTDPLVTCVITAEIAISLIKDLILDAPCDDWGYGDCGASVRWRGMIAAHHPRCTTVQCGRACVLRAVSGPSTWFIGDHSCLQWPSSK